MKKILQKYLPNSLFFYSILRYRIVVLIVTGFIIGVMDGFGLAMFIPLLQLVASEDGKDPKTTDNDDFLTKFLLDTGIELNLVFILVIMLTFFILKGLARWYRGYLSAMYRRYFVTTIQKKNINLLSTFSYKHFIREDTGYLQNTISSEMERVVQAFGRYNLMIREFILVVAYMGMAFLVDVQFAFFVVSGGLLVNVLFKSLYKKTKSLSKELVGDNSQLHSELIQTVSNFKYLVATGSFEKMRIKLNAAVYDVESRNLKIGIINSFMVGAREPLVIMIIVSTIIIQVNFLGGKLSSVILSLLFFYRGLGSVTQLQTAYNQFLGLSGSLKNLENFQEKLQKGKSITGDGNFQNLKDIIHFKNVTFSYGEKEILKDINFTFHKNKSYALVGESGSGKTTLANLLSGLISPTEGSILFDGMDLRALDTEQVQKNISYITQEPVIFTDTIFNNITFWEEKTERNLARLEKAIEKARLKEFISGQKDGLETYLGSGGVNLSGGQKQRISIAREFYKENNIMIMDEATSALDSETEKNIKNGIDDLKGNTTLIVIAHRLSTIRNVDQVLLLNKGRLIGQGSYIYLLKKSRVFKDMVELQEV